MPLRNGHKALTSKKIDKALRRLLPSYIKLFDGVLNDEKIYEVCFGCPWIAVKKWISVHMSDVRPELLDEWAETIAQQIVFTVSTEREADVPDSLVDASWPITQYYRRRQQYAGVLGATGAAGSNIIPRPAPQVRLDSFMRDFVAGLTGVGAVQGTDG